MITYQKVRRSKHTKFNNEESLKIAIKLCKQYQVPVNIERVTGPLWNGKDLKIRLERPDVRSITVNGIKYRNPSDIVHDVAHYLWASKQRRKLPEFGLGDDPGGEGDGDLSIAIQLETSVREEVAASALGICFEALLGLDAIDTFEFHQWETPINRRKSEKEFNDIIRRAIKKEFLTKRGLINANY